MLHQRWAPTISFVTLFLLAACHHQAPSPDAGSSSAGAPAIAGEKAAKPAAGITGVVWQLVQIEYGDDTLLKPDDPSRYTLELSPDGGASVRADCNRGGGTFVRDGSRLTLKVLAYTEAACSPESLDDRYRKALDQVVTWMLRDGKLHLAMALDTGILSFAPAPR